MRQLKQEMPILKEDDNALNNFRHHKKKEYTLKKQDIENNQIDLIGKILDTRNYAKDILPEYICQNGLLKSESSSFLRKIKFREQEFSLGIPVSNIKYPHLRLQNKNPFYLFYDQLNYALINYFTESKTTKGNMDKILSKPLMTIITKKLSY